jgi:small-conductance mechanosensitive channel
MSPFSRILTLSLVLWPLLGTPGSSARAEPPQQTAAAVPQPLTPQQAQQAISVLEDDHKRSALLETLHAIAQAAPAASADNAAPATGGGAPPEPAAAAAKPAEAPPDSPSPLTSGGLIQQLLGAGSTWFGTLADELVQTAQSATRIDLFMRWLTRIAEDPQDRRLVVSGAWRLVLALAAALAAEWLARRALRSPISGRRRQPMAVRQDSAPVHLLHRLPLAIARMVLDLLPVAAFAAIGNFLIALLGSDSTTAGVLVTAINAYAIWRGIVVLTHALVSPDNAQLRLFAIGDDVAHYFERWVGRLAGVAVFGLALVSIAGMVGLYAAAYRTFNNLVLLIVHAMLVIVVVQSRQRVAGWIRAPQSASGALALIRNRLAPIWHVIAIFFILGSWMVDAVEIQNGYVRLMRFLFLTGLVLLGARILSILALGVVDRALGAAAQRQPHQPQPATRLPLMLHRTARLMIAGLALLALLEIWGIDALAWFESGAIGRQLLSAAITIIFAALAGMALWEWTNAAIERHMQRLMQAADHPRLARMRTLLPILRTTLFVVLLLVVGLTALSELGVNIAPLLAGAGIVGIAVGFGSQKLVQDLITGIFLLVENAFQVGDWVTVAGLSGSVEHLSIRSVRLRSVDGAVHIVPFSAVSSVTNASRDIGVALVSVTVPLEEDTDRVGESLRTIAGEIRREPKYQEAILSDFELWGVDKLDSNGATISVQIRCTVEGRWKVQREFTRRLKRRFQEAGIRLVAATSPAAPPG